MNEKLTTKFDDKNQSMKSPVLGLPQLESNFYLTLTDKEQQDQFFCFVK